LERRDIFLSADQWQVFAGEDWLARLRQELDSARVVVLLLSRRSVARPWVNFEAGAAWLTDKAVIPLCFGDLRKEELPKPYSGIQAVDLRQDAYYLLSSVAHHLNIIPPVPTLPNRDESFIQLFDALDRFTYDEET
jgi:hypothetical protein